MRTRDVRGRRIVDVRHRRRWNDHTKRFEYDVVAIILDDGTLLYPFAYETEESPEATIFHLKTARLAASKEIL